MEDVEEQRLIVSVELLRCCVTLNKMVVNTKKVNIVIFAKSANAKAKRSKSFAFGSERIEVVKKYTYLGIIFVDSGSFFLALSRAVSVANNVIGGVLKIVHTSGADSCVPVYKYFEAYLLSILWYGIQVWGI